MPRLLLALSLALAIAPHARGEERKGGPRGFKVVVNAGNAVARIDKDDLARIYLGKKTLWDSGARITPALADEGGPIGLAFLDDVIEKSLSQYRAYWKRLLFSGGGVPPRSFRNSAEVVDFVARQPGAIGVVEASTAVDEKVKVLAVE